MRARCVSFTSAMVGGLCLLGCAAAHLSPGDRALRAGALGEAVRLYELDLARDPENTDLRRALGLAYLKQGRTEDAVRELTAVVARAPGDGEAILYLGMAHEARGETDQAIERYRGYLESRRSPHGDAIRDRLAWLRRQRTEQWAREQIAFEDSLAGRTLAPTTVGVLGLDVRDESGRLDGLGDALANQFITDLGRVRGLTLVERLRLDAILRELDLVRAGAVEPGTAPRLGKLMAAGRLVTGQVQSLEGDRIRIDVGLVDVPTARVAPVADEGDLDAVFRLEAALVFKMLDAMGIVPTPLEREEIERVPTRSLAAFLAFGRGLAREREGRYEEASAAYGEALGLDPDFTAAAEARELIPTASPVTIQEFVTAMSSPAVGSARGSDLVRGQLGALLDRTGVGVTDSRPEDSRVPPIVPVSPIPDPPSPPEGGRR